MTKPTALKTRDPSTVVAASAVLPTLPALPASQPLSPAPLAPLAPLNSEVDAAPDAASSRSLEPVDPELLALVVAYPLASHVRFRSYHPTIRPRDWRRMAEQTVWGMQRGDLLEVTGYGATVNFPEALLTRRLQDGVEAMVFPSELFAFAGERQK